MAEGLALAASVIAVLQITNTVISVCYDYSATAKGASSQLVRIRSELESLRNVLQQLEPLAKQAELVSPTEPATETKLPAFAQLCGPEGLLHYCLTEVKELEHRLKTPSWCDGFGPKRRALVQVLQWPMKEADTEKKLKQIARLKDSLILALNADQTALSLEIQKLLLSTNAAVSDPQHGLQSLQRTNLETQKKIDSNREIISDVGDKVEALQLETRRKAISKWLSATDPSTNYIRACRGRQANTGTWFTKGKDFSKWKSTSGSMLWLHGKAGSGKTILASTCISELLDDHQIGHKAVVAYFFFDFNDSKKQKSEQMIRALIAQLFTKSRKSFTELDTLFMIHDEGERQPDVESLISALRSVICETAEIFIFLDALDECSDMQDLLSILSLIKRWEKPYLHILLTSRRLMSIEDTMEKIVWRRFRIDLQSKFVNQDISAYVHDRLLFDPGLQRWRENPEVQEEIRSSLMVKSEGMFRWAVCQLDALQRCPNLLTLRNALSSLPKSLDETYERILCGIPEEYSDNAVTILRWLTFSMRPMRLRELAEVIIVNVKGNPWSDENARFPDPKDLLAICSSLIRIDKEEGDRLDDSIIRLAHSSVQEYLVSKRIQGGRAVKYYLREHQSHEFIAASCLAYLLGIKVGIPADSEPDNQFVFGSCVEEEPLCAYAVEEWTFHARLLESHTGTLERVSKEFLDRQCFVYNFWASKKSDTFGRGDAIMPSPPPLWMMAFCGVLGLVRQLLDQGANIDELFPQDPNGTALCAASRNGAEEVVRYLLLRGAAVDLTYESYGTPLQRACAQGYVGIANALVAAGADVNYESADDDPPLRLAVRYGKSLRLVRLLTSAGAEVNLTKGETLIKRGSVLVEACVQRSQTMLSIIHHLLDEGADVNSQGGRFHTALQTACARQGANEGLVELLLEKVANINAVGGKYGTALQAAASFYHNDGVVQLLIEKGAHTEITASKYGTPLQAVCAEDHDNSDLVAYLLGKGADINAQGGKYGTALHAASIRDNREIVKLLLYRGADTTICPGRRGSALHAACAENNVEIVSILLDHGADVNLHASRWGTSLEATLSAHDSHNRFDVMRLLLQHGAVTNGLSDKQLDTLKWIRLSADANKD